ncbi:DUF1080 domain-containing protein [Luteitalea sp. TBR-22]|uniref:3-keto-disaccharide hydrolase n=1 Tax=Luteitalea sp. TBR-22 TaxID=2802971 RepID=UPI001EF423BC|nr:DUF1080 domain-containing protein [Luteitalea sp. TBR-22]
MPALLVGLLLASPVYAQAPDVVHLFNGKDLSTFTTWLVDDHREDPDRVFTVVDAIDGAPAIRISGQKYGGIATREEFESYHLVVEFRWGAVTWAPRKALARDSGILVHCQGPDGNTKPDFNGPWMRSIESQIIEGGVGDFILVAGSDASGARLAPEMTATVSPDRLGQFRFDPQGAPRLFTNGQRINWSGRDVDRGSAPIGFRGVADVEGHGAEWTRLEVIVEPERITNIVNGHVVNVGTRPSLTRGRIMIQSEGAEIYFRRVDLYPLPGARRR